MPWNQTENIEHTKKYAGDQNIEWWDAFFGHHHTIWDNYMATYWPLQYLFQWNIGVPSLVSRTHHHSLDNTKLNNLVQPR